MIFPFLKMNKEHLIFNLQYKHSGTFANCKIWRALLPSKVENMRLHSSQSGRENVTLSRGISPLTSYREVTPPPPPICCWSDKDHVTH